MPGKDKEAKAASQHRWYLKNKERHSAACRVIKIARISVHREKVNKIKSVPCVDCGGSFDPICMDFDHVTGNKILDVSQLVLRGNSWKKIEAEIAKCEIVCSNCHRIRTRDRMRAVGSMVE